MSNAFDHENTPFGAYGEFNSYSTDDWTDEDWRAFDEQVASEIEEADDLAAQAEYEADAYFSQYDDDPNPYAGDYSEM